MRKNGYIVWLCRCTCGNELLLDTRYLQRATITDCGCKSGIRPAWDRAEGMLSPRQRDLTGQQFGQLTCISPTAQRSPGGSVVWSCRCSCGNLCTAVSSQLTKGFKKSCGCLSHPPLKDFVGRQFGQLTVVGYGGKHRGMHFWTCRCDCGRETTVGQTLLQNGKTRSCGCLKASTLLQNLQLWEGTSVTQLEAGKKRRLSTNASGYTGVYWHQKSGKWAAQITFQRKTYYLGSYAKLEDAVAARQRGEEMHDQFLEWYHSRQEATPDPAEEE